jgi:parallel beta-helix repeat protein
MRRPQIANLVSRASHRVCEGPRDTRAAGPWGWNASGRPILCAGSMVVVAAIALGAGSAAAASPTCGQTITRNTRLTADLRGCLGNGIVIGADDITLDLNGHTISGDNSPCAETCDFGVDNTVGHHADRVIGGTIRDFGVGILSDGGTGHMLIAHNHVSANTGAGIALFGSDGHTVVRNVVSGPSNGFAILLNAAGNSTIAHNAINHGNDEGISLFGGSSNNVVRHNVVRHSMGGSIDIIGARNRIEHNRIADNGDGIILSDDASHDNTIQHNVVTGTGFFGAADTGGFGTILDGADDNTVNDNTVIGGRGSAILVLQLDSATPAEHNVISHNLANSKLNSAIFIGNGSSETAVNHDIAYGSGHEGIEVTAPATTLTANTAFANHDLGIQAVAGVIDGGGNRAFANGDPTQCLNINC